MTIPRRVPNKNPRRPRKNEAGKRRRNKVHQRRLIALGLPEADVGKLNSKQMRALLRHPKKLAK